MKVDTDHRIRHKRSLCFSLLLVLLLIGGPSIVTGACPAGCECLSTAQATAKWGAGNYTTCTDEVCGYVAQLKAMIPQYCYQEIPVTTTVTIRPPPKLPPDASFTANTTSGTAPLLVQFTDQSLRATSWSWEFGDGVTSSEQSPSHIYTQAGTFTVRLTVSNSIGSDVALQTVTVSPRQTQLITVPIAEFTAVPNSEGRPQEIQFDGSLSSDPEGISSYYWDFGDGTGEYYSNSSLISHTYAVAGTYTVTLRVVDKETPPQSAIRSHTIIVFDNKTTVPSDHFNKDTVIAESTVSSDNESDDMKLTDQTIRNDQISKDSTNNSENNENNNVDFAHIETSVPATGTISIEVIQTPANQGLNIFEPIIQFFSRLLFPKPTGVKTTPCENCREVLKQDETVEEQDNLSFYLAQKPRIRAQMAFEVDQEVWLFYDDWPEYWRDRLNIFYLAYQNEELLPMDDTLPIVMPTSTLEVRAYRSADLAQNVYLAQVAYALWMDKEKIVPWRLEDWSDDELSYLLSSKVLFTARRLPQDNSLFYVVKYAAPDATDNLLSDPRIPFQFMQSEPEEGEKLLGSTPEVTVQRLSEWFQDYLWHSTFEMRNSGDVWLLYRDHPLLEDRLKRYNVTPYGDVYVVIGCWDSSSLFADLVRSVNIPVKKVTNRLINPDGELENHSGLVFNWQGDSGNSRYLIHTDNLYAQDFSYFFDPAPAHIGTPRGVALWNYVWLDPTSFGQDFSYSTEPGIFGEATFEQDNKYWEMSSCLVSSANKLQSWRYYLLSDNHEGFISIIKSQDDFSDSEAEKCWETLKNSLLAYGDGDVALGFQRLFDGPDSRHSQWCLRTGKCA